MQGLVDRNWSMMRSANIYRVTELNVTRIWIEWASAGIGPHGRILLFRVMFHPVTWYKVARNKSVDHRCLFKDGEIASS